MTVLLIPSCDTIDAAFAYVASRGRALRVVLYRGPDGYIRGIASMEGTL